MKPDWAALWAFLLARLRERSTWVGVFTVAGFLGVKIADLGTEADIAVSVMALLGAGLPDGQVRLAQPPANIANHGN